MLSDIYGKDKKEKFLILKNLIKDGNGIGILYGKKGIGKKYLAKKVIEEIKEKEDIVLFIDSQENWHQTVLSIMGIYKELTKEELLIHFYEFLHKFKGRIFIVFNNSHLLSEKQFLEIIKILGIKESVTLFFIGEEEIKQLLNPIKMGKLFSLINFIFEINPPDFEEFYRFFKEKYGNSLSKKEIKKLFNLSHGSFSDAINMLENGNIDYKKDKMWYLIPFILIAGASVYIFYNIYKEENGEKVIKDMKIPIEGSVEDNLPIKVKRERSELSLKGIEDKLYDIYNLHIPNIRFYQKKPVYTVQVAAFKNKSNAQKLKAELLEIGFSPEVEKTAGLFKVNLYVSDKNKLEKVLKSLKKIGFKPIVKKVK